MTAETMPEPEGPEDERFVYVVTAAGVEALREGAVVVDIERRERRADVAPPRAQGGSSRAHLGRCSPPGGQRRGHPGSQRDLRRCSLHLSGERGLVTSLIYAGGFVNGFGEWIVVGGS
jgi:hypothetical protein